LVELLVVIGIIAVLAAIILPAIKGSLVKGRTTKSAAQLREIHTTIALYASENDGNYPYAFGTSGLTGPNSEKNDRLYWYNVLKVRLYPHATVSNRSSLEGANGFLPLTQQNLTGTLLRSPNAEKSWPAYVATYGYNDKFAYQPERSQKLGLFYSNIRTVMLADNLGNTHALTPINSSTVGKLNARNGASADNASDGKAIAIFLDGHAEMLSPETCKEINGDKTNIFWGVIQ